MTCAKRTSKACSPHRVRSHNWRKPWERRLIDRRMCFVITLLAALWVGGCAKHKAAEDDAAGDNTAVPEVTVTQVKRAALSSALVVNGNLTGPPNRDARVAALVPGRVARVE